MEQVTQNANQVYEVSVFPIPGVVAFPYQKLELHVFEQRYKRLVEDGVRQGREVAIALAKNSGGEIATGENQYLEVFASGNTLFKPCLTLSAGPFVLKERLPDGRYLIEVDIVKRVKIRNIIQDIPYPIAEVVVEDDFETDDAKSIELFAMLSELSQRLLGPNYEPFVRQLPLHVFFNHDLSRYTFEVFKWCRLEPDQMQLALEMRDPKERAQLLITVIGRYLELTGQPVPDLERLQSSIKDGDSEDADDELGELLFVNFRNKKHNEFRTEK